jgi:hypothetical protein
MVFLLHNIAFCYNLPEKNNKTGGKNEEKECFVRFDGPGAAGFHSKHAVRQL